jgi:polygalacturonase
VTIGNIGDFGAIGDGTTNDQLAIQAAIDSVASGGGGTVIIPSGKTFCTGSLELTSNVTLHLEAGAVLTGSANPAHYTFRVRVSALSSGEINENTEDAFALIGARDAHNIAITFTAALIRVPSPSSSSAVLTCSSATRRSSTPDSGAFG